MTVEEVRAFEYDGKLYITRERAEAAKVAHMKTSDAVALREYLGKTGYVNPNSLELHAACVFIVHNWVGINRIIAGRIAGREVNL